MIQVTDKDIFNMQLSVADNFGFQLSEIEAMSFSKLSKWYNGAKEMRDREKGD